MVIKIWLSGNLTAWLKTVSKEHQARVQVNDLCTETIYLTREVKQGCPLSPLLCDSCTEALAIMMTRKFDIRISDKKERA